MKIEFENSIRRLCFLCRLPDVKIAWINLWCYLLNMSSFSIGSISWCYFVVSLFCCSSHVPLFHGISIVSPVFRCFASVPVFCRCSAGVPCSGVSGFIVYLSIAPWKHQRSFGFLVFSWGIENKQWSEIG